MHGRVWGWVSGAIVVGWFIASLQLGRAEFFRTGSGIGPLGPIQVAIFGPIGVFVLSYLAIPSFRSFVDGLDVVGLAAVQVLRILGAAHLVSWGYGLMAGTFALSVGIGNSIVALVALSTVKRVATRAPHWRAWLLGLTLLGMVEFGMTIALAMLGRFATPTPFDPPRHALGYIDFRVPPLSIFPTFLIPLFSVIHCATLARLRRRDAVDEGAVAEAGSPPPISVLMPRGSRS
ncbi:MAG: hypothetical protein KDC38_01290 [Planctomycetes bacterium]|nr:hypothetical protein [Planctomycetota bacterium]